MARTNKVEACIFCGSLPCTCNKSDKPARTPKPKAKDTGTKPKSRFKPGAPPAMPTHTPTPEPQTPSTRFSVEEEVESQEELEFKQAVKNLAPILKDIERARYKHIINPTKSAKIERRLIEWREHRAEAGHIPNDRED